MLEFVRFSPDGRRVASGGWDTTCRVFAVDDDRELAVLRGRTATIHGIAWSPDGAMLATTSQDGTTRLWDPAGACLAILRGHDGPVMCAVFTPDGRYLLTGGADGTVRRWVLAENELRAQVHARLGDDWSPREEQRFRALMGR